MYERDKFQNIHFFLPKGRQSLSPKRNNLASRTVTVPERLNVSGRITRLLETFNQ